MDNTLGGRIKKAWNTFRNRDQHPQQEYYNRGYGYYGTMYRPDRVVLTRGNERSIITSVLNRISLDVASINIKHCLLDDKKRFKKVIDSELNNCLNLDPNIDQNSTHLMQDLVLTMFNEGCAVLVPVDTSTDPKTSGSFDILSMRVGKVLEWYPKDIKISLYNEEKGIREDIIVPKNITAIVENPLYSVMNDHNSTLRRLTRKLVLLDSVDEQVSSGKLDLIIQLPYTVRTTSRKNQAEQRRKDIENQLTGSAYGIAYTDGTEKITQLNRPVENNLMVQVEYLTRMLYSQLGITTEILDGTADESVMMNYYSRTVQPIVNTIVLELKRKFLTLEDRQKGESIMAFRDPFSLVPVSKLAELADKFTRNEILSSNEIRGAIGFTPSEDPKADQLVNSNISQSRQKNETYTDNDDVDIEKAEELLNNMDSYDRQLISQLIDDVTNDIIEEKIKKKGENQNEI